MKSSKLFLFVFILGLFVFLPSEEHNNALASVRPFQPGDVFAGVGLGHIKQFDSDGNLIAVLDTTSGSNEETGMCFDSAGNLYTTNFTAQSMTWFDTIGSILQHPWGGPFGVRPESCVVDAFGNIFTGEVDGSELIRKFNPQGDLLATYKPATQSRGIDWIDLASDQCTMFYTSEGSSVKRFDVCSNMQLPDFATGLPRPCYALRIRSNDEVMVACASAVYRLDPNGTTVQTYSKATLGEPSFFFALNLDPDGTSFWTGGYSSKNIYRVDIETGTVLISFNAGTEGPTLAGLAVYGELTSGRADQDEDGLYDDWELNGVDTNGDGQRDLVLSSLDEIGDDTAPNPLHKDIYVWVDWLAGQDHDHKPPDEALLKVKEAFKNAPVSHINPDGQPGVNLHIIMGSAITETQELTELGQFSANGANFDFDSQEFSSLKWQYLQQNGSRPGMASVFHYALFAHYLPELTMHCPDRTSRPTGIAPMINTQDPGGDFIVAHASLDQSDILSIGGTFMHELGHTLDLGHGGPGILNDVNFKPNHLSVMNYSFTSGLFYSSSYPRERTLLDYSKFDSSTLPDLDETSLNEWIGLNGPQLELAKYGTVYFAGYSDLRGRLVNFVNLPIDWNNSGGIYELSVQANINRDDDPTLGGCQEYHTTLTSTNEWNALNYSTGSIGTASGLIQPYPSTTFIDGDNVDLAEDIYSVTDGVQIVNIDVKPGSDPNSVNCNNQKGVIPVAILTTDAFDALTVDHMTVTFEGASETHVDKETGEPKRHEEDIDADGDIDLVFHFRMGDTNLTCDSTEGTLTGMTYEGFSIIGTDDVRMIH